MEENQQTTAVRTLVFFMYGVREGPLTTRRMREGEPGGDRVFSAPFRTSIASPRSPFLSLSPVRVLGLAPGCKGASVLRRGPEAGRPWGVGCVLAVGRTAETQRRRARLDPFFTPSPREPPGAHLVLAPIAAARSDAPVGPGWSKNVSLCCPRSPRRAERENTLVFSNELDVSGDGAAPPPCLQNPSWRDSPVAYSESLASHDGPKQLTPLLFFARKAAFPLSPARSNIEKPWRQVASVAVRQLPPDFGVPASSAFGVILCAAP